MKKLLFLLVLLSFCTNAKATVTVNAAYGNYPVQVCQPSDANTNCTGGKPSPPTWDAILSPISNQLLAMSGYSTTWNNVTTYQINGLTNAVLDGFYNVNLSGVTITDDSSISAVSFITSGGTSSQFVKGNGSLDSIAYYPLSNPSGYISSQTTTLSGAVTGSGTTSIATTLANLIVQTANVNWTSINGLAPINENGINWADPSFGSNITGYSLLAIPSGGANWSKLNMVGVNWNDAVNLTTGVNWQASDLVAKTLRTTAIKPIADSTTAVQVQTFGGTSVMNFDTTNKTVILKGTSEPTNYPTMTLDAGTFALGLVAGAANVDAIYNDANYSYIRMTNSTGVTPPFTGSGSLVIQPRTSSSLGIYLDTFKTTSDNNEWVFPGGNQVLAGWTAKSTVTPTCTPLTSGGYIPDGTYYYTMVGTNNHGTGMKGVESAACTISGGGGNGSIVISWTPVNFSGIDRWSIYRTTTSGTYTTPTLVASQVMGDRYLDTLATLASGVPNTGASTARTVAIGSELIASYVTTPINWSVPTYNASQNAMNGPALNSFTTTDGAYQMRGFYSGISGRTLGGTTNTYGWWGFRNDTFRAAFAPNLAFPDNGTMGSVLNGYWSYGHYNADYNSNPITTNMTGLGLNPAMYRGTVTTWIDLSVGAPGVLSAPATWAATTGYAAGSTVKPTSVNGHYYVATLPTATTGTSGGSEPTWPNATYQETFTVSGVSVNPSVADTYTQNSNTYTVTAVNITAGSGTITTKGNFQPSTQTGTLTRTAGAGDATIAYSAQLNAPITIVDGNITWTDWVIPSVTGTASAIAISDRKNVPAPAGSNYGIYFYGNGLSNGILWNSSTTNLFSPGAGVIGSQYAASTAVAETFALMKNRGTLGVPTVVSSGDAVGNLRFDGYDGSAFQPAAKITASVDATPGANDMPGRLQFFTTPDGSVTATEAMRIDNAQKVWFGSGTALDANLYRSTTSTLKTDNNMVVGGTIAQGTGASTNHAVCWKASGVLGYCSVVVDASGVCGTCN